MSDQAISSAATAGAESLPYPVLHLIFEHLDLSQLRKVPLVCSSWHAAELEMQEQLLSLIHI